MNYDIAELTNSLHSGFIDKSESQKSSLIPSLLTNCKKGSSSVLNQIVSEIENCDEFFLSVAFLTKSGVAVLMNSLIEAQKRGVKGKILVSEYLGFTQPEALRALMRFENIDLRVAITGNMHGKTYLFQRSDLCSIIIGSSNLTASALKSNNEVNIRVSSTRKGALFYDVINHLNSDFCESQIVNDNYINSYALKYQEIRKIITGTENTGNRQIKQAVTPNSMQRAALDRLKELRAHGEVRALVISATGTGKTFLSAFDVRAFNPERMLFLVHRRNIANSALETYQSIFGDSKSYGIFSGKDKNLNADFVFSTIQTISKNENLRSIEPGHFDYIVIDETHRAGATSYQNIIKHFNPKFLLGMTATPERTDGHDIFSNFDHNIAYEIRLHEALEEKILAPFHYFGVTDISVGGTEIDELSDFNRLTSKERIDHILNTAKLYGCDNGVTRGLIFCSRKEECYSLSEKLNLRGIRSIPLTGDSTEREREDAINCLETDDSEKKIDYIVTVDIFNEGIDIPKVNQILMLRPTSSAIIFVQQLGRGLRRAEGKDHLTVIDFIGNYQNNYLVPIALYGDISYNKDRLRRLMSSGSNLIPGSSTINFDQISKQRIFESIDKNNLNKLKDMKSDYKLLKFEIGRSPMMMDYVDHGRRDPLSFVEYSGSYYQFVRKVDSSAVSQINTQEIDLLSAFSKEINNGKRVEDSIALLQIIESGSASKESIANQIKAEFEFTPRQGVIDSVFNNLSLRFVRERSKNQQVPLADKLGYEVMITEDNQITPGKVLQKALQNSEFSRFLIDSTKFSIEKWKASLSRSELHDGFILYEKYSRKDVFRILNWEENPIAQNVGGYQMSKDRIDIAIFVNYEKHDHSNSTKYEDEFIDNSTFQWMSKNRRTLNSPEIQQMMNTKKPSRIPLFVKKSNDEGLDFYYMGELKPIEKSFAQAKILDDDNRELSAVNVTFKVTPSVEPEIYKYITSG